MCVFWFSVVFLLGEILKNETQIPQHVYEVDVASKKHKSWRQVTFLWKKEKKNPTKSYKIFSKAKQNIQNNSNDNKYSTEKELEYNDLNPGSFFLGLIFLETI